MTTAHRYPDLTALDDEGVTVHYDLCRPCALVMIEEDVIDDVEMTCPDVDIEEGYTCDRCDRPISL